MLSWRSLCTGSIALSLVGSGACGSDASNARVPFTVWVFDQRLTVDGMETPIANARVAFDPAGGGPRIMLTTEADGHVTFDGDFSQGGASVTVLSDNHAYVTMLEATPDTARARPNTLGKPSSDLVILPLRLDDVAESLTVELRGNLLAFKEPTNQVALASSALARLGSATALEPRYTLRAPRGRPFFVLGTALTSFIDPAGNTVSNELVKAFRIDLPARTDDQLLDIDLATIPALPSRALHMRAEVPRVAGSPFGQGTQAFASVLSADSALTVGIFSSAKATAEARAFDLGVTLVTTDIAPERPLTQAVLVAPDGSRSVRTEQGVAAEGTTWSDFPLPPTVRDPDATRTARDPIPLDGFPAGAELTVRVLAGGQLFWILYGPPGGPRASSFTIPYRDEVASTNVQVFAVSVTAQSDRVDLPSYGSFYRRSSSFRDLRVSKR